MARWGSNNPYVNIDLNVSNIYLSGDYPNITFHFDCDFNYYCPDGWASMSISNINFNTQVTGYDTETKTENVSFSLTAGQESARYGANYYNPQMGKSRQRTVDVHAWISNGTFTGGGWTTVTSPAIPAPSAYSISSIANITEHSVTVSHVLTNVRNYWYVNLYDEITGKYWNLNNDTGNGTTTITGLNPNQTYRFRLRVMDRNYNYCYQAGGGVIQDTTTLGKSTIASDIDFDIGNSFGMYISGFSDAFTHTATFEVGGYSFSRKELTRGQKTITPTATECNSLYAQMASVISKPMSISLTTYNNGTSIGTHSRDGIVRINQDICRPVVNSFSYKDSNSVSVAITGNNQYLIQNLSTVQVTSISATAKNKATMTEYWLDVAGQQIQGTSTTTSTAIVSKAIGEVIDGITVRAKDSRGLEGFLTKTLASGYCIPYELPQVKKFEVVRRNQVEATCILNLDAAYSLIKIGSVNKNAVSSVRYRYKLTTSSSWGALYTISCTTNTTTGAITYGSVIRDLDVDKSYDFEIQITDKGGTTSSQTVLVMGTPVLSLRKGGVGINKVPDTGRALDVAGAIYTDTAIYKNSYTYQPMSKVNGYWGFPEIADFIRTPSSGLLPYASGGTGYVGSKAWPFKYGYFYEGNFNRIITSELLQSMNLELKHTTPYIDFHYNNGTSDYNVRLINDASATLSTFLTTDSRGYKVFYTSSDTSVNLVSISSNVYLGNANNYLEKVYTRQFQQGSDRKMKHDIRDLELKQAEELIMGLRPVSYIYNNANNNRKHMGFIAQEVAKHCESIGIGNMSLYEAVVSDGESPKGKYYDPGADDKDLTWGLSYTELIAPMISCIQTQKKEIDDLEDRVNKLEDLLKRHI